MAGHFDSHNIGGVQYVKSLQGAKKKLAAAEILINILRHTVAFCSFCYLDDRLMMTMLAVTQKFLHKFNTELLAQYCIYLFLNIYIQPSSAGIYIYC